MTETVQQPLQEASHHPYRRPRDAATLIEGGFLERLTDFEHHGEQVLASRLGYRMNESFATQFFGRIFLHPDMVFTAEMLQP